MLNDNWSDIVWPALSLEKTICQPDTGVEVDTLREIGKKSVWVPGGFVSVECRVSAM